MRQRQERKRERLVFVLFVLLSVLVHVFLLAMILSNVSSKPRMSRMPRPDQLVVVPVDPVNLQPSKPPPTPEATPASESEQIRPRRNQLAQVPVPTPTPVMTPIPTPLPPPTPQPTPIPTPLPGSSPSPQPTPTALPSVAPTPKPTPLPSVTPQPTAMPTPSPSAQVAALPPKEQAAKNEIQKFFKDSGMEVPDKVPYGYKSWDDFAQKVLSPDWEEKARVAGTLNYNPTQGSGGGASGQPSGAPNDNASPDPHASGAPSGDGQGNGSGWSFGNNDFSFPGTDKLNQYADVDPNNPLSRPDIKDPFQDNPLQGDRSDVDKFNDHQINPNDFTHLNPGPGARPLQLDYRTTDTGVTFEYDGNTFFADFPPEAMRAQPGQMLKVKYNPSRSADTSHHFDLTWQPQWADRVNDAILAVVTRYNQDKQAGGR